MSSEKVSRSIEDLKPLEVRRVLAYASLELDENGDILENVAWNLQKPWQLLALMEDLNIDTDVLSALIQENKTARMAGDAKAPDYIRDFANAELLVLFMEAVQFLLPQTKIRMAHKFDEQFIREVKEFLFASGVEKTTVK